MEKRNKITSLLTGSAIGDALGVPYEFKVRGTFRCTDMVGYGTHNQPIGTWSDDTSMTLCLAEQIAEGFNINALAQKFVKWAKDGYMTVSGLFDIGNATSKAIMNIRYGVEPTKCGGQGEYDNGNGSLMRIAPLAFCSVNKDDIRDVSSITHAHEISVNSCVAYIYYLQGILNGREKKRLL